MPAPKTKEHARLSVEKSVFGGDGFAVWKGKACFIEGALPGEIVEAEVFQENKQWARARVLRVLERSPFRIDPVCRYYGRCGGCQYQHVTYEEELRLKEAQVREVLERVPGAGACLGPILFGPKEYRYRRSASFRALPPEKRGGPSRLAYVGRDNVTPVPVDSCDLLDPALEKKLGGVFSSGASKIGFKVDEAGKVRSDTEDDFFRARIGPRSILASSKGFFQNNWEVTQLLSGVIAGWVRSSAPGAFFDLYAGVGTFTLLCAEGVGRAFCVEESRHAVQALCMNCQEAGRPGIRIIEGRVERVFEKLWEENGSEDALLFLDPPRQGLEKNLAAFLAGRTRAKALIYVSCDPATLARDLVLLLAGGAWKLKEIVPFDMFPRTKHVEAAALLYYNGGS